MFAPHFPWSVALPWLVGLSAACGSSSGSPGSAGDGGSQGTLTLSAGSFGTLTCPETLNLTTFEGTLELACNQNIEFNGSPSSMTLASLSIPHYHGAGSYDFNGSSSTSAALFDLTLGNEFISADPGGPGVPTTHCSLMLTGPTALQAGDLVTGHIHCTDMGAIPVTGDGGYTPEKLVTVDGRFSVTYALY